MQMVNIRKSFGVVVALDQVNFEVGYNEVVGLLGDNGAGKSTLIKVLTGYHSPDNGDMYFKGEKIKNFSVSRARDIGIETVYQEKALADQQSLWRNIFMGREIVNKAGFLNLRRMNDETLKVMVDIMGFTSSAVSPESNVKTMSGGERQGVAIARALYFEAELIILDEPTMSLSLSETKKVLDFVGQIKKAGKSCIFIDHNIYHVYPVADRIVIVDRGKIAGQFLKKDITLNELVEKLYLVARTGKTNNINSN
jgi:simple sugar transport system ATP-binding protein